jgi:hypothetical protein
MTRMLKGVTKRKDFVSFMDCLKVPTFEFVTLFQQRQASLMMIPLGLLNLQWGLHQRASILPHAGVSRYHKFRVV